MTTSLKHDVRPLVDITGQYAMPFCYTCDWTGSTYEVDDLDGWNEAVRHCYVHRDHPETNSEAAK